MPERPNRGEGEPLTGGPPRRAADDGELVAQVKRGETQAYGELVRRYQDRIFNTCWRICGHLEDARDLTQDAFLKAFEGLSKFRGESGFYTWVFRVAVNLALTHRRRGRTRRVVSLDSATEGSAGNSDPVASAMHEPLNDGSAGAASDAELHSALGHALHGLEDEQRAVVVLRDMEGFNYEQIAAILQIPEGTVKSRLFRGRMALREAIEPMTGGAGVSPAEGRDGP